MSIQAASRPRWIVALVVLGALSHAASAGPVFFVDFEGLAVTTDGDPVEELSVVVPGAFDGRPIVFSRDGGTFDVIDLTAIGPTPDFESRSLSVARSPYAERYIVKFPGPVQSISVDLGDFGTYEMYAELLAGRSNELGGGVSHNTVLRPVSGGEGDFRNVQLTVTGEDLNYAAFGGVPYPFQQDSFAYTAYADNLRFELADGPGNGGGTPVIPLPPAVLSFPLAALVAYAAGKRRRRA